MKCNITKSVEVHPASKLKYVPTLFANDRCRQNDVMWFIQAQ